MSNTIDWGKIHYNSWSPETNLTGAGATPSYQNEYSFQFDGVDDYVDCGTITALNGGISAFSISLWFKYTGSLSTSDNILVSGGSLTNNDFYIQPINSTTIRYGHSASFTDTTISSISINTWYNLMLVHNGTSFSLYLNGTLQNTTPFIPTIATNQGTNFNIGRYNISGAFNYLGNIDEVAVWNTDQSANASAIGSTIPTDLSIYSPLSWWRMGEDATFDGIRDWNLVDQGTGGNDAVTQNIAETERVTDVPT